MDTKEAKTAKEATEEEITEILDSVDTLAFYIDRADPAVRKEVGLHIAGQLRDHYTLWELTCLKRYVGLLTQEYEDAVGEVPL